MAPPGDMLKALAGSVAHELNNVLTATIGNLSLLRDAELSDPETRAAIVGEALAAARRGVSLSEELEAFAGCLHLEPHRIDVNRAVHTALGRLPQRLKELELRVTLSKVPLYAEIDGEKLARAIAGVATGLVRTMAIRADRLMIETQALHPSADRQRHLRIAITCEGEGAADSAVTDALANFRSGAANLGEWGLASANGFVSQSGGQLAVSVHSPARICVAIDLPLALP